jgi:hypothetical protein
MFLLFSAQGGHRDKAIAADGSATSIIHKIIGAETRDAPTGLLLPYFRAHN